MTDTRDRAEAARVEWEAPAHETDEDTADSIKIANAYTYIAALTADRDAERERADEAEAAHRTAVTMWDGTASALKWHEERLAASEQARERAEAEVERLKWMLATMLDDLSGSALGPMPPAVRASVIADLEARWTARAEEGR